MYPQDAPAPPQPDYNPKAKVDNALTVTQPGEQMVCEVKRHPIGIFGVYVATGLLLLVAAVLAFGVVPHFVTDPTARDQANKFGALAFVVVAAVGLLFAFISTKVYWGNSWVVTTDSITQINQVSLFKRESSQLSLGNLEDVTSEQNGILTHIFNYGLLRVETAGERSKFVFLYCPNPNYYAQQVLAARENFEQRRHGEAEQRAYRAESSYVPPAPAPTVQNQSGQAGDPGYGAYPPPTASQDYPSDSSDPGVNINA